MNKNKGVHVPKGVRENCYVRDNWSCQVCGKGPPKVKLTLHHLKELSIGGTTTLANLVTVCADCHPYIPYSPEAVERQYVVTTGDDTPEDDDDESITVNSQLWNILEMLLKFSNRILTILLISLALVALVYIIVYLRAKASFTATKLGDRKE